MAIWKLRPAKACGHPAAGRGQEGGPLQREGVLPASRTARASAPAVVSRLVAGPCHSIPGMPECTQLRPISFKVKSNAFTTQAKGSEWPFKE